MYFTFHILDLARAATTPVARLAENVKCEVHVPVSVYSSSNRARSAAVVTGFLHTPFTQTNAAGLPSTGP